MKFILHSSPKSKPRLTIHHLVSSRDTGSFADDVRAGLIAYPKFLLPKYFYDELGSRLFEAICCLPEYSVTRDESEILRQHTNEILTRIEPQGARPIRLIELGSGSSSKTRYVIEALLARQSELYYVPVDISPEILELSAQELLRKYVALRITAYAADYTTAFRTLASDETTHTERNVVLFLGSSIGNFDPADAQSLLKDIRNALRVGDALLLGTDLKKSAAYLEAAYDDALGVTAAFNLNLLARINRELDGDFAIKQFQHRAVYNELEGRVEIHLVSRVAQTVRVGAIGLTVNFEAGETIHTENSYKYDAEQICELAHSAGFAAKQSWQDSQQRFRFNLLVAE